MIILKTTQNKVFSVLQSVCGIIEKRHTIPILANVMIKKSGNALQFIASDLEIQTRTTVDLGGEEGNFSTTVAARKLLDILSTIPSDQTISLESQDDKLILKGGKSRFILRTLPSDDFPLVQESTDFGPLFSLPQKIFKNLLQQVSFSMAANDIRYYLNGMLFRVEESSLYVVATDGHRMAYATSDLEEAVPTQQEVIIPRKSVLELQRLLSDSVEPMSLQFAPNQAKLIFNGFEFVTKLVEGKFPDYKRAIAVKQDHEVTINRPALLAVLRRISTLTNEKFKGIKLALSTDGNLRVTANNAEQEEAFDELDIDYDGPEIDIAFNVGYLLDVLSMMSTEQLRISLSDSLSSTLFMLPETDNFKYVVMPMRI